MIIPRILPLNRVFLPKMPRGYDRARCSSGLEAFPKVRNISGQGRFAGRGYYGFAVQ